MYITPRFGGRETQAAGVATVPDAVLLFVFCFLLGGRASSKIAMHVEIAAVQHPRWNFGQLHFQHVSIPMLFVDDIIDVVLLSVVASSCPFSVYLFGRMRSFVAHCEVAHVDVGT